MFKSSKRKMTNRNPFRNHNPAARYSLPFPPPPPTLLPLAWLKSDVFINVYVANITWLVYAFAFLFFFFIDLCHNCNERGKKQRQYVRMQPYCPSFHRFRCTWVFVWLQESLVFILCSFSWGKRLNQEIFIRLNVFPTTRDLVSLFHSCCTLRLCNLKTGLTPHITCGGGAIGGFLIREGLISKPVISLGRRCRLEHGSVKTWQNFSCLS